MLINKVERKIYKLLRPPLGEILMLHRVMEIRSDRLENRQLEITPYFLEQTILKYTTSGYRFASLDDVYLHLTGQQKIPKKFVCLTFDDGFADNYELAYPILQKYHCPFTIYITTGFVDKTVPIWWYEEERGGEKKLALNREQLIVLSNDPLCTIGAHTVSHPHLSQINPEMQKQEIASSKQYLETLTGKPVEHFAYPHGDYNEETMCLVKECGFKTAVLAWGNYVRKRQSSFLLNRKMLQQK